jgi:hypothetical protein
LRRAAGDALTNYKSYTDGIEEAVSPSVSACAAGRSLPRWWHLAAVLFSVDLKIQAEDTPLGARRDLISLQLQLQLQLQPA